MCASSGFENTAVEFQLPMIATYRDNTDMQYMTIHYNLQISKTVNL